MKKKPSLITLILTFLGLLILTLYQNCGNIHIAPQSTQEPSGAINSPESQPTSFHYPTPRSYNMRVAFFVDVSRSMITSGCYEGIDLDKGDCFNFNIGQDPFFNRLKMIENWMNQIDDYLAARNLPLSNLEVAFIPFSQSSDSLSLVTNPLHSYSPGQDYFFYQNKIKLYLHQKTFTSDRSKILRILDTYRKMYYAFSLATYLANNEGAPIQDSKLDPNWRLSEFKNNEFFEIWASAGASFIRTSIPQPSLDVLKDSISSEINKLKNTPEFDNTRFEIAILSDGVVKPHHEDIRQSFEKLWEVRKLYRNPNYGSMGGNFCNTPSDPCPFEQVDFSMRGTQCSVQCRSEIDTLIQTGTRPQNIGTSCDSRCINSIFDYASTPSKPREVAKSFLNATLGQWGDYKKNYSLIIQMSLKKIETLFLNNPKLEYRFNFVRLDSATPQHKTPEPLLTLERNWLEQSKVKFQGQHRHVVSSSGDTPFYLFPGQAEINGYKLNHFFVVNPHARINSIGILTLDSDADGLFDHEEDFLGTDKNNPRGNGVCLDVITYRIGCITNGCDPQMDMDGDGLNQCEELTLGTSDMNWDTDGDGISDYLEVVYGLNPLQDDRYQDNNGDGISNFVNFTLGAGPWTYIDKVEDYKKIQFHMRESHPIRKIVNGVSVLVPTYAFQLKNLPTLDTLGASGAIDTFNKISKLPTDLNTPPIIASQYQPSINRILLLGRVEHNQSIGDGFWLFKPMEVPFNTSTTTLNIEIQDLQPMPWLYNSSGGPE